MTAERGRDLKFSILTEKEKFAYPQPQTPALERLAEAILDGRVKVITSGEDGVVTHRVIVVPEVPVEF